MKASGSSSSYGRGGAVWGIIFLVTGAILLLQLAGILPWSLWLTLVQFWPLLIILLGLYLLLRHAPVWVLTLVITVVLLCGVGGAILKHGAVSSPGTYHQGFCSQPLHNIKKADITLDFDAGSLKVNALLPGTEDLFQARASVYDDLSSMDVAFYPVGSEGRVVFRSVNQPKWPLQGVSWDLAFSPDIPLSFQIRSAAGSLHLDLTGLQLSGASLNLDAGSCVLKLPVARGNVALDIRANVTALELDLPDNVPARVFLKSSVTARDIPGRFSKQGDYYVTPGFSTATNRYDITIECNVSSVRIK